VNNNFWAGKKVFITGHTGFKGGWLSLILHYLGAEVSGLGLHPRSKNNFFDTVNVSQFLNSHIGDIRDFELVSKILLDIKPEIVFHLAAQPLVRYSYINPIETYSTNVLGTVNIFEAVRNTNTVRAIVNITSDKCYDNKEWLWAYRENDSLGGFDPYSSSKGCSEIITFAYQRSFFSNKNIANTSLVALASARAGNVIGGGDWSEDRLVPDILKSIDLNEVLKIRNPNAIRPWQHVLEPLFGYLNLAQNLYSNGIQYAEPFNFGPNDEDVKTVKWIVETLTNRLGKKYLLNEDVSDNFHEAQLLRLDCTKAKIKLNWQPKWNIEHSIEKIIEWHLAYNHGDNMRNITINQIEEYIKK